MNEDSINSQVFDEYFEADRLDRFVGGWIVGDFSPTLVQHKDVEVAIKCYPAGHVEPRHHHKLATELTVIVSGSARMDGQTFTAGQIVRVPPGRSTDFEAIEETVTVVVKTPSVPDDKYVDEV